MRDLGDPQQAAQGLEKQYLVEFMSTRLGVRREAEILSASERLLPAGKSDPTELTVAYEVEVRHAELSMLCHFCWSRSVDCMSSIQNQLLSGDKLISTEAGHVLAAVMLSCFPTCS